MSKPIVKPKFVLSIAGGGIRGVAVAQFLKRLEENMQGVKIKDKFDMFAGTSIGSLIVGTVVYTDNSAKQISDDLFTYTNANRIMDKSIWDEILGLVQTRPMYDGTGKKQVIKEYVGEKKMLKDTTRNVIMVSYDIDNYKPRFFKSWEDNITVIDAANSSSSAPCYFPSVNCESNGKTDWYIDGGICANYPSDCVYADALKLYGADADIRILCIGTGYPEFRHDIGKKSKDWGSIQWVTEGDLINMVFDSSEQTTLYRMEQFTKALGHKFLRVNGKINNMTIDDTTEKNIATLKKTGDEWWDKYGKQVLELLDSK